MIKIKVSNLSNGRYDYEFEGKATDLEIYEPYIGNYKASVVISKFDNQLILDSDTVITANLICDRCAEEFHSEIKSKFRNVYLFRMNYKDSENENEEIIYLHPDTDKIELSADVRDFALLAIPMKKLCTEDCKGLCPKCGKNLNDGPCKCYEKTIDSRWEPIQKLKNKE